MHNFNINGSSMSLYNLDIIAVFVLMDMLSDRYKVEAVKFIRHRLDLGLKDALSLVEFIANNVKVTNDGKVSFPRASVVMYEGEDVPF